MTEQMIRDLAARHGLAVYKRITTGNELHHFATFELSGTRDRVRAAWPEVEAASYRNMSSVQHANNPGHAGYGRPFIVIQSVWCEDHEDPELARWEDDGGRVS
jgi:hypothetical protein